ncbi:MAG: hypothetical protein C0624_04710 [Desulfuromonas sp.]|nr:MAG: hypothetical protein C0624_04710 [Desulfuromonas sp.]
MISRLRHLGLLLVLLTCSCTGGESGIEGTILFDGQPLSGVAVEIYLKQEKDRSTAPFSVATSDAQGDYRVTLPTGRYFVIARKKLQDGERARMLMGESPANPVAVIDKMTELAPFELREMGLGGELVPEPETFVVGRLSSAACAIDGAWVYVYTEPVLGLVGPSYAAALRVEADGSFRIPLPAGDFYLTARKRADGARIGEPRPGDLNGLYPGNPVRATRGETLQLGPFPLRTVDAERFSERHGEGKFVATDTRLHGQAIDEDGRPAHGIYVYAYLDSRMVGKPTVISAATGDDGRFVVNLPQGGTWYIGARSAFGGPLEPGEQVGTWDGQADHGVRLADGERRDLDELTVREVW